MIRVNFVLPPALKKAAGGYKVVYQYANALAERGIDVCIYYNSRKGENSKHIPAKIMFLLRKYIARTEPKWIVLNQKIKKESIWQIDSQYIRKADITVCTSIDTVMPCYKMISKQGGKLIHFVQGHENWFVDEKEVDEIYHLAIDKICVSSWIAKRVGQSSRAHVYTVLNGIDRSIFFRDTKIRKNDFTVCMMYKLEDPTQVSKNSTMGIHVLIELKKRYPQLQVNLFSVDKRPKSIPDWMNYTYRACEQDLQRIYNESSIYLCTSIEEGYGLPCIEAMSCGCVLVTTDNKGIREFSEENKNAFISPIRDEKGMLRHLVYLFENPEKIHCMGQYAEDSVKKISLNKQADKFIQILLKEKNDNM